MERQYSVKSDFVVMSPQEESTPRFPQRERVFSSQRSDRAPSPPRNPSVSEVPTEHSFTLRRQNIIRQKSKDKFLDDNDNVFTAPVEKGNSLRRPASFFSEQPRSFCDSVSSSNSSGSSQPPPYNSISPPIPFQFINGYLELASSDARNPGRYLCWSKVYAEINDGFMRLKDSRELVTNEVVLDLKNYFVAIQTKRLIRMDSSKDHRTFRALTDSRALKWLLVLSQFCRSAPSAEGYTKKLGGSNKDQMQVRYLRLTEEGLLSWYKTETSENPQGTIQVRGEEVDQDKNQSNVILIHTAATEYAEKKRYLLSFMSSDEALRWFNALGWHARRNPLEYTSVPIRNAINRKAF